MVIISDKSKYYPIYPVIRNCSVLLEYIFIRKNITIDEHFLDIITLQALAKTDDAMCIIAETHIAVLGLPADDPDECGNCIETTTDKEYIILNYLYFKIFLFLIAFTGFLLLFVQLKEICSIGKHVMYKTLNENSNYIWFVIHFFWGFTFRDYVALWDTQMFCQKLT